jgi:carboxymethylenebutenolidase
MSRQYNRHLAVLITATVALVSACDSGTSTGDSTQTGGGSTIGNEFDLASIAPERPVEAATLPYAEVDEQLVYGHFAFPADMVSPLPGIIVIHERFGLDDGVRALADRIAGQGYVVLAVDLYGGKTAPSTKVARDLMLRVVENPEPANENIRQAHNFLTESAKVPRIGTIGWSFGGGWALNAALLMPDKIDAAVNYYGQITSDEEHLAPLNAPLLGIFGANDRGLRRDAVEEFEQALDNLGKTYEIEIYAGVGHAFADPARTNYNAEVAELAWSRAMAFLDEHLVIETE